MSNRAGRAKRFHRPEPRRYPMVPGVLPDDSEAWRAAALEEAHLTLAYVPGTVVHVLVYEREAGLAHIAAHFGEHARTIIAERLEQAGPNAVPTIAGRFDRKLTFDRETAHDQHECHHEPRCQ